MIQKYDWSKYKEGLHLLLLDKEQEQYLIKIIECDVKTAMQLNPKELLNRRRVLVVLLEKYGEVLLKEYFELYFVIGNMEANYSSVIKERNLMNTDGIEDYLDSIPVVREVI